MGSGTNRRVRSDTSIAGRLAYDRLPETIVVDDSPEFADEHLDTWVHHRSVRLRVVGRDILAENCIGESGIEARRLDNNRGRPHSSLDNLTPREFAAAASLRGGSGYLRIVAVASCPPEETHRDCHRELTSSRRQVKGSSANMARNSVYGRAPTRS